MDVLTDLDLHCIVHAIKVYLCTNGLNLEHLLSLKAEEARRREEDKRLAEEARKAAEIEAKKAEVARQAQEAHRREEMLRQDETRHNKNDNKYVHIG